MSEQNVPLEGTGVEKRALLRYRMAVRRQIELRMNSLIERMVELVDMKTQVPQSRMEKTQMKNLLGVALNTASVEVIKHYILYQVGRDAAGNSWRSHDFGKTLAQALDELKDDAKQITQQVCRELQCPVPDDSQIAETWMLLTRAYLGQLNRYFYYQKEDTQWPRATH
jgi:hypothetical protein